MLPQFGFIVAQAGADSQQPPYYTRPYMPQNIYYDDRFYRPPLPPISQSTEWQSYPLWQTTSSAQEQKPIKPMGTISQDEVSEVSEDEFARQKLEFDGLMHQMDSEYWEQCDDIFRGRLLSLKDELETIQRGTHSAFEEIVADAEVKREQTIEYAEHYKEYELSINLNQYEIEERLIEEEYNMEKKLLLETVLQTIEERRKQIKENKNDIGATDLMDIVEKKIIQGRKVFRKKVSSYDSQSLRPERRRQNRMKVQHNIHAFPTALEEEELVSDFLKMKGKTLSKLKHRA
ncbi:hypothetical protein BY458DRAFT_450120 [Sporodiniella umbellata]|nr:hypothetical protein BY458DRAFT_450120 [Sporodiniella umbellata]